MSRAYVPPPSPPLQPRALFLSSCVWARPLTSRDEQPQDAIDLTDNDIQILGNFPLSPRIRTLLLARNRVASIQHTLPTSIPNLTNLVLASNSVTELSDLDVLGKFPRLTQLVLMDNPVTKKEVRFCCAPSMVPVLMVPGLGWMWGGGEVVGTARGETSNCRAISCFEGWPR